MKKEKPLRAIWDKDTTYNQWGTKYISAKKCPKCNSDVPSNMYGMGTCVRCNISVKP